MNTANHRYCRISYDVVGVHASHNLTSGKSVLQVVCFAADLVALH